MDNEVLETINALLKGAIDDINDPEARYKIRSAQQLLSVIQQNYDEIDLAMDDDVTDEEVLSNLRNLGYLD